MNTKKMPATRLRSAVANEKQERAAMIKQVSRVPFIPAALVGRKFTARADAKNNWLGAKWFVVLGDLGPMIVPGHSNATGKPYVYETSVAIETDSGLFSVTRNEFVELTRAFYDLVPVGGAA